MKAMRLPAEVFLAACLLVFGFTPAASAQDGGFCLRHNGDGPGIVIPEDFTARQADAATQLQQCLKTLYRREFPITADRLFHGRHYISIGKTKMAERLDSLYGPEIRDDGFLLHTENGNLYIFGHAEKSELYGVCHFLENCLNCYMTGPESMHFPRQAADTCLVLHDLQNPDFAYREVLHPFPNVSQEYADWHKLQNRRDLYDNWVFFVHSFKDLVPESRYFDTHPEWFSEIGGRRIRDGQLCLSNPEVLEILCQNLARHLAENPGKRYCSVSQNDNFNSCTCARCRHLDSLYGGPSGTLIHFINQVAGRFPDVTISTLAYQQTRRPPKNIRPADNVNIMLCSIECQRQTPIADNPAEKQFVQDVEGWTALTDNIFLWDYVVQFRNLMDPFPNLHVLQSNLRFFRRHGIRMIFEQGAGDVTENYVWRGFLLSHLLWDTDIDVDSLRNRFFDDYYGENRAPFLKQYLDTMTHALTASGQVLGIYGYPMDARKGYLSPEMIAYYQSLFRQAEAAEPTEQPCSPEELEEFDDRLRLFELPLEFAVLDLAMSEVSPELSYFEKDGNGVKTVRKDMAARALRFVNDCRRLHVLSLEEMGYSPEEFYGNIQNYITKSMQPDFALGKRVKCRTKWSKKYDAGGSAALTDGILGGQNYFYNWLGFEGEHLDAVIDLGTVQDIHKISMDFYFYPLSWIFAPENVTYYVSDDKVNWQEAGSIDYENEVLLAKAKLIKFEAKGLNMRGRYVRAKARSLLTNPSWHRGYGLPCWIFTDEIIVN